MFNKSINRLTRLSCPLAAPRATSLCSIHKTSINSSASTRPYSSSHPSPPDITKQKPEESLFAKIVAKQIPVKIVYEDDMAMSFRDINPCAPTHVLVIPKKPIGGVSSVKEEDEKVLGHLFVVARKVAELEGIAETGYRLVVNEGKHGQQSVRWIHVHVIGGKQLTWPPYSKE